MGYHSFHKFAPRSLKTKPTKDFLVEFDYEYYCQGVEKGRGTRLVRNCLTFMDAIIKVTDQIPSAKNFENLTIE